MFARVRSMGLAGSGAIALTIALSGVVAAATVLTALSAPTTTEPTTTVVDTTATFEDLDGNGVDDDCQTEAVVADPVAAASAEAAADLNGDGTISVEEAAQSDRTGGTNCNHGGYVSGVAHGTCTDAAAPEDATTDPTAGTTDGDAEDGDEAEDAGTTEATETEDAPESDATCADTTTETSDAPTTCDTSTADGTTDGTETTDGTTDSTDATTDEETAPTDVSPNAHGKAVAAVAQSDAVGGKNCNHGGAVSEVAKNHDAARQAREAAKAAREAAREARRAEREAARAAKHHGKPG